MLIRRVVLMFSHVSSWFYHPTTRLPGGTGPFLECKISYHEQHSLFVIMDDVLRCCVFALLFPTHHDDISHDLALQLNSALNKNILGEKYSMQ